MNIYGMCATFAAGILVAGGLAIWWDWKHPQPIRMNFSPERPQVLRGTYGKNR